MGTGSPIGSRDYSNGGFANGERKCVFLEDGINSSNSKLTMKGKRLNLHALENQKRNLNNRGISDDVVDDDGAEGGESSTLLLLAWLK